MRTSRRPDIVLLILLVVCACCYSAVAQDSLTALYRIQPETISQHKENTFVRRSAKVELDPLFFSLPKHATQGTRLRFPAFTGDLTGSVTWERAEGPDSFSFAGELVDEGSGYFILTVHQNVATASIHDDQNRWLRINPDPEGYIIEELDPEALPGCGTCQSPFLSRQGNNILGFPPAADTPKNGGHAQIDVLVVYTTAARVSAGSAANIEAQIVNSANLANLAYENSDIPLTLSVVHMAEISYPEDYVLALTLAKLTFPNEGSIMAEVHDLRDMHDADMVALITSGGDVAGIGWPLSSLDGPIDQTAFSITVRHALGGLTFAHELGHNMGCDHDQQNITAEGYRLFNYSRGWRFNSAEDGILRRTIMSYPPGAQIPYFSNPGIMYKGTLTGVPIGDPDEAHCARTINISAPHIANNRPRTEEGEAEGEPEMYPGYYCQLLGNIYHNQLLRSLLPPYAGILFDLLNPDTADLNGYANPQTLTFEGNGMLDCAYELGLLHQILMSPGLDLSATGGVTHAIVAQALAANQNRLTLDIGSEYVAVINVLAPGLLELAAAFITIGDQGSIGFVSALLDLVNEVHYIGRLNLYAYTRLPGYLSAEGDADGDGFTNRQEYEEFAAYGPQIYIAYALNPGIFPLDTEEGEGEGGGEGGEGEGEGEDEGEGEGGVIEPKLHSADLNKDMRIDLSELLRVIQFYNSSGYHCAPDSEDGYNPGPGDRSCTPHDSDYNPQDWQIKLSELLRIIQFYNSNGYHPLEDTEDGFKPGSP